MPHDLESARSNCASGRAAPFVVVALLAIVGGGLLSAALAHAPTRQLMWLVAYLVLVVGVAQGLLGLGQARLALSAPSPSLLAWQWCLFNGGNVLVITGTLRACPGSVSVGALLLLAALVLFLLGVRRASGGIMIHAYRAGLVLLGASALTGVVLAALRPPA